MDLITKMAAAVGGAATEPGVYADEVFSADIYSGNESSQSITNGVDLSENGGAVIIKNLTSSLSGVIADSENGTGKVLQTDNTSSGFTTSSGVSSFNNNGFSLNTTSSLVNNDASTYISYSLKKQEKFFDVVTYSGNGSTQTISHNLNAVPKMIWFRRTDTGGEWAVYSSATGNANWLRLSETSTSASNSTYLNSTSPTASVFTVGNDSDTNASGGNYVAYLFAHNEQAFGTNSDEPISYVGSYQGSGTSYKEIDCGFEAQFVIIKRYSTSAQRWYVLDTTHGMTGSATADDRWWALDSTLTSQTADYIRPSGKGFVLQTSASNVNGSGHSYLFYAVRANHKPTASAGTDVFARATRTAGQPQYVAGFPVDTYIMRNGLSITGNPNKWGTRVLGGEIKTSGSNTDSCVVSTFNNPIGVGGWWTYDNGIDNRSSSASTDNFAWMFKREPKFHDVICYRGTGSNDNAISHGLTIAPEFIIAKRIRANSTVDGDWICWHKDLATDSSGTNLSQIILLNSSSSPYSRSSTYTWDVTSTTFTPRRDASTERYSVNTEYNEYVAYLFATNPGISKLGSYTGSSTTDQTIDCGFTNGARFVLIKIAHDSDAGNTTGNWMVFDDLRGIVSGNDTYISLNTNTAQSNASDVIDPHSSGFTIPGGQDTTSKSGYRYIYLAIA